MKKLLALTLIPLIMGTSCTTLSEKIEEKITIKNYREKSKRVQIRYMVIGKQLFFTKNYDFEGDGKINLRELYIPGEKEPIFYGFDFNEDGIIDIKELWVDEKRNGWNGDEMQIEDYLKKGGI